MINKPQTDIKFHFIFGLLIIIFFLALAQSGRADTVTDLQNRIKDKQDQISNLENEIKIYQREIDGLSSKATTLTNTLKSLDLSQKKLAVDIKVTENKIAEKILQIQRLGLEIKSKEGDIADNARIVKSSFTEMYENDNRNLVTLLLGGNSIAMTLDKIESLGNIQNKLNEKIHDLTIDRDKLSTNKAQTEQAHRELLALKKKLSDQRQIVLDTANEQKSLLAETHASEATYKKLLAEKQSLQQAFEQEIDQYESQLHILVDLSLLPHKGSGILSWPVDNVYITQYFGNTSFATANPQVYKGRGHTGVDFRASIGTPIKAAESGTVIGIGNTDVIRGCYSYGKWIFVRHNNGLSTVYGHLSFQAVKKGDIVSKGQIIGYSGNTGHSTGPHLHLTVLASQGARLQKLTNSVRCKNVTIPVADTKAYLDPLTYL